MQKFVQQIVITIFIIGLIVEGVAFWKSSGISDSIGPVLSMEQKEITVSIDAPEEELLKGISAWDSKNGDVSDTLVVQSMTNFIEPGVRRATIAAFDQDNNVSKIEREVIYSNYQSPRFSLDAPLRYVIGSNAYLESPFEVEDCLDGDLSSSVTIREENGNYFSNEIAAEYSVIYRVINSAGDIVELPATLQIYNSNDYNGVPIAQLSTYLTYVKKGAAFDPESFVEGVSVNSSFRTMEDMQELLDAHGGEWDGAYTMDDITITNPVDVSKPGAYEVTYKMSREEGNSSKIYLLVIVEE